MTWAISWEKRDTWPSSVHLPRPKLGVAWAQDLEEHSPPKSL